MPEIESVEYDTIGKIAGVVPYVDNAYKFLKFIYEFGKTDPIDRAISEILRELETLRRDLDDLGGRLNTVTQRLAKAENSERIRFANMYRLQIESAANQIKVSPGDRTVAAYAAFEAGAIADLFLNDIDLWNWTDIKIAQDLDGYGQPVGEPRFSIEPPDFKLAVAFPVYSLALTVWVTGLLVHTNGNVAEIESSYGERLRRHIQACGTRETWIDDGTQSPVTLQEQIRSRLTCYPVADTKFDVDRVCGFTIQCRNVIDQQTSVKSSFSLVVPESPLPTLCTIAPEQAIPDELDFESNFDAIKSLELWVEILGTVLRRGMMPYPATRWTFPSTFYYPVYLYGITESREVHLYQQMVPHTTPEWTGPVTVATDWWGGDTVSAGGGALYTANWSGLSWDRFASFAAVADDMGPAMTMVSSDPVLAPPFWSYMGGAFGSMYGLLLANPAPGDAVGDLYYVREKGSGGDKRFSSPKKVGIGWDMFKTVFCMGEGILYGVRPDGTLRWQNHTGWVDGSTRWEGPKEVASGFNWSLFDRIVAAGNGVIYGIYPSGRMVVFQHEGWKTGDGIIQGPSDVDGTWNQYVTIFADLPAEIAGLG